MHSMCFYMVPHPAEELVVLPLLRRLFASEYHIILHYIISYYILYIYIYIYSNMIYYYAII